VLNHETGRCMHFAMLCLCISTPWFGWNTVRFSVKHQSIIV